MVTLLADGINVAEERGRCDHHCICPWRDNSVDLLCSLSMSCFVGCFSFLRKLFCFSLNTLFYRTITSEVMHTLSFKPCEYIVHLLSQ